MGLKIIYKKITKKLVEAKIHIKKKIHIKAKIHIKKKTLHET